MAFTKEQREKAHSLEARKKRSYSVSLAHAVKNKRIHAVKDMMEENEKRLAVFRQEFDPISGRGAPLERFRFKTKELEWWLPMRLRNVRLIDELMKCGSIDKFLRKNKIAPDDATRQRVMRQLVEVRIKEDFCFWAASFVTIKRKQDASTAQMGSEMRFVLNLPQRKTLEVIESMRLNEKPIRMIILKARQWGGSTLVQMYMAWLQLVHREGLYSAIVAHQSSSAMNIRSMYSRMLRKYPPSLLGKEPTPQLQLTPYGGSRTDVTITQNKVQARDVVISIGSMQSPESVRGADIALAHFSEVGLWRQTEGKTPEDVIQAISSSILEVPLTMDVMESTAKGENNLFHHEWLDAKEGRSKRAPVFVPWFGIELYSMPFKDDEQRRKFATELYSNRERTNARSVREESGSYLYGLWLKGASLEAIQWYIDKRRTYRSHDAMASEYPSDDEEAFAHSGQAVFDRDKVERLKQSCCPPQWVGEVAGAEPSGKNALKKLRFVDDKHGCLKVWEMPDTSFRASDRYVVATDVGGRSERADYSVILVLDRWWRTEGEGDVVVAEWHGHCRHDRLAWKMAQIAAFYNNALLVVESNTFETRDMDTEGEHSAFILEQIGRTYRNMYARQSTPDKIRKTRRKMWGFQTNTHTKALIIDNLITMIDDRLYTEREVEAINEYKVYQRTDKGTLEAAEGYHDDRLMARAIGLYISQTMPLPRLITGEEFKSFSRYTRKYRPNEATF